LNSYFATPDNSLTLWGDQGDINILADYGAAALFTVYLSDHYGGSALISYFMQQGIPGIAGINNALSAFGYRKTFDGVFHDWRLANLIRSDNFGLGLYNYDSLDLNAPDIIPIRTYALSGSVLAMAGSQFNTTITYYGDDTGISLIGPYGSDYIKFTDWNKIGRVSFAGSPYSVYGWRYTGYWYSGSGADLIDVSLTGTAYVDPSNPVLAFSTKYDIEEGWDFGFVQVSTDGGSTWTSLENAYTTYDADMDAHPTVTENLPGLTGTSPGFPGWVSMTFDLSDYAGETVMIAFRYFTDWYTSYEGWYVSDVKVSGNSVALQGNDYPAADFEVSMVQAVYLFGRWRYLPVDLSLNKYNVGSMLAYAKAPSYVVLVVTPIMNVGATDYLVSGGFR
ncbi:MAG TPA: immune inhibitor A, partial [Candidatus Methanomethylicus sp.]|nr:immune inhibitor A [Candidatus Methanomethylicus sp.]